MKDVVVLISGSGSNLAALLDTAAAQREQGTEPAYRIVAVGADRDAAGLAHAARHGVPSFVVRPKDHANRDAWGDALAQRIREAAPDPLVVSAGLMRILPPGFVEAFRNRLINTHPALLPLFPGAHAVRDALAAGATETGVTVHLIDEGVDTGPVIAQRRVAVRPEDTEDSLHERIKQAERPLLAEVVAAICSGNIDLDEIAAGARGQRSTPDPTS